MTREEALEELLDSMRRELDTMETWLYRAERAMIRAQEAISLFLDERP